MSSGTGYFDQVSAQLEATVGTQMSGVVSGASANAKAGVSPVSYTHLDVYKRQTLFSIVKEICDRAGMPCAIKPDYTAEIEYECQYMESDFDFIRRLARQYHEWLYYDCLLYTSKSFSSFVLLRPDV